MPLAGPSGRFRAPPILWAPVQIPHPQVPAHATAERPRRRVGGVDSGFREVFRVTPDQGLQASHGGVGRADRSSFGAVVPSGGTPTDQFRHGGVQILQRARTLALHPFT